MGCFLISFCLGNTIRTAGNDDNGICLPGYRNRNDRDGFIINDSNSRTNSKKRWSYEQLSRQMRNLWAMYN